MLPVFPTNTAEQIEEIIDQIGREVDFVTATYSGCSTCSLDTMTDTSTDSFCPVCSGLYWIPVYTVSGIVSHVTWGNLDDKSWQTGGMIDNGECTVKFMHSDEREELVNEAEYVVVDDREMDIKNIILRGVPVNRILVKLKEKER